jgi:hypothetical protein
MPLARISAAVSGLAADQRYIALDSRRGVDYHRLRPQSVPHASPKRGVSQAGDGIVTIDLPGPVLDPGADADRVYQLLIKAMEAVRQAMVTIRNHLAKAVRAAGLWYHEPTPANSRTRQKGGLTKSAMTVGTPADLRSAHPSQHHHRHGSARLPVRGRQPDGPRV